MPDERTIDQVQEQLARAGLGGTRAMAAEMAAIMHPDTEINLVPINSSTGEVDPNLIPNPERVKPRYMVLQEPAPPPPQGGGHPPGNWTGADIQFIDQPLRTTWEQLHPPGEAPPLPQIQERPETTVEVGTLRSLLRQLTEVITQLDRGGARQLRQYLGPGLPEGHFIIGDFLISSRWPAPTDEHMQTYHNAYMAGRRAGLVMEPRPEAPAPRREVTAPPPYYATPAPYDYEPLRAQIERTLGPTPNFTEPPPGDASDEGPF